MSNVFLDFVMGILLHGIFNISNTCFKINLMLIIRLRSPLICGSILSISLKTWCILVKHVGAKPPPTCFVSSWVFHTISHYLKSIDSFYTKLGRWTGDLLPIIFTWEMSVNVKFVTSQWWRHVFCHFWSF